jgi:hypothetical protein
MSKKYYEENQIAIIIPESYVPSKTDCSICGFAFRHQEDVFEHTNHGCCLDCSLYFMQPNRVKWKNGWRPSKEEVKRVIFNNNKGEE